jgi:putative endonuclease
MERKDTGARGEKLAREFLARKGYRIIETNYRCREGEIDIVARDGESVVFIEVRTKTGRGFGTPEESITTAKKRRMAATAARYRQAHPDLPLLTRIDVVAIELARNGRPKRIELIQNAVTGD